MEIRDITSALDHTVLNPDATWEQVRSALDDAVKHSAACAMLPPSYVKRAKEYAGDAVTIGTVIGFPNGYSTTAAKVFEASEAIRDGAGEIDMVINLGWLRDGMYDEIENEIAELKAVAGNKVLKVIIETCMLSEDEKIRMCDVITKAGADFIKTSTGFAAAGASAQDILLFASHIGSGVSIKASGGISTLEDAQRFIALGASRIGASRLLKLIDGGEPPHPGTHKDY